MPDPVDISTFPRAFDTSLFTPREAEAYEAAWCDRRLAVAALTAAMRGDDDDERVADLLGPALAAAHRCNAIEEAAAERIRQDELHASAVEAVFPGTRLAAQLVIGPPVDGDRASEDDLAQRGAYAGDEDGPTIRVPQSDEHVVGVWRYVPGERGTAGRFGPFLGYDDPIVSGRDLSAAIETLEQAIEAGGYGALVDAARALVQLHRGIPR